MIDNLLHFYSNLEVYNQHKDQGLISPDSICFISTTGKIITQNEAFGNILKAGRNIQITDDNVVNCTLDTTLFRIVPELPEENIDTTKIYLVQSSEAESDNNFIEYIYTESGWEKLGEFKSEVDLSPYITREEAIEKFADKTSTNNRLNNLLSSKLDKYTITLHSLNHTPNLKTTIPVSSIIDNNGLNVGVLLAGYTNLPLAVGSFVIDRNNLLEVTSSGHTNIFYYTTTQDIIIDNIQYTTPKWEKFEPMVLGEVANTAYDGKKGKDLEDKLNKLEEIPDLDINNIHNGITLPYNIYKLTSNGNVIGILFNYSYALRSNLKERIDCYIALGAVMPNSIGTLIPMDTVNSKSDMVFDPCIFINGSWYTYSKYNDLSKLKLGTTEGTAFDGAAGKALQDRLDNINGAGVTLEQVAEGSSEVLSHLINEVEPKVDTLFRDYLGISNRLNYFDGSSTRTIEDAVNSNSEATANNSEKISVLESKVEQLEHLDTEVAIVVTELPTENINTNKMYLVKNSVEEGDNQYTEYLYVNNKWEKVGEKSLEVTAEDYVKYEDLGTTISRTGSEVKLPIIKGSDNKVYTKLPIHEAFRLNYTGLGQAGGHGNISVDNGMLMLGLNGLMNGVDPAKLTTLQLRGAFATGAFVMEQLESYVPSSALNTTGSVEMNTASSVNGTRYINTKWPFAINENGVYSSQTNVVTKVLFNYQDAGNKFLEMPDAYFDFITLDATKALRLKLPIFTSVSEIPEDSDDNKHLLTVGGFKHLVNDWEGLKVENKTIIEWLTGDDFIDLNDLAEDTNIPVEYTNLRGAVNISFAMVLGIFNPDTKLGRDVGQTLGLNWALISTLFEQVSSNGTAINNLGGIVSTSNSFLIEGTSIKEWLEDPKFVNVQLDDIRQVELPLRDGVEQGVIAYDGVQEIKNNPSILGNNQRFITTLVDNLITDNDAYYLLLEKKSGALPRDIVTAARNTSRVNEQLVNNVIELK
ncbi:MAG: hypothetical protein K2G70_00150, partial [Turicibacter sp.]|nr:hypothetical protein [Turicibacter sp.]